MKLLTAIFLILTAAANASAFGASALGALNLAARPGGYRAAAMDVPVPEPVYVAPVHGSRDTARSLFGASERFLGLPYVLGPLGEGENGEFDRGPLISFAGLDCTTFVEETMAFALGGDQAGVMEALRRIRYADGAISYQARNHFTELDWLPNNIAAGFLRDITAEVAGPRARTANKMISKKNWYAKKTEADLDGFDWEAPEARARRAERLRALGGTMPDRQARISYVPLEDLPALLSRIPSGTVVSLVREDRADKPTLVSHQFFVFDGPGGKTIRHAALGKQVMDVDAAQYIAGLANSSWRVLGFNLAEVVSSR